MSEEEKQAIDRTKRILYMLPEPNDFKIIINLAERQQKEIIDLKERLEIAKVMKNKQREEIEELNNIIYENNFEYNDEQECLIRKYYNFNSKDYFKVCCSDITCKECLNKRIYKKVRRKIK